jgi:hypothetical protein
MKFGAVGGMQIGSGNRSARRKPAPLSLCPPQIPHLGSKADRRGEKPATDRLSYGTALCINALHKDTAISSYMLSNLLHIFCWSFLDAASNPGIKRGVAGELLINWKQVVIYWRHQW